MIAKQQLCLALVSCILPILANAYATDESQPIKIEANHATLDQKQKITVFSGQVLITKGTLVIHAAEGTATQDQLGNRTLSLIGRPVTFKQKADDGEIIEGQGNKFDYDTKSSLAILTSRARVKKGKNVIVGDTLTYNTKTQVYSAVATAANGMQPTRKSGRITVILDGQSGTAKN